MLDNKEELTHHFIHSLPLEKDSALEFLGKFSLTLPVISKFLHYEDILAALSENLALHPSDEGKVLSTRRDCRDSS